MSPLILVVPLSPQTDNCFTCLSLPSSIYQVPLGPRIGHRGAPQACHVPTDSRYEGKRETLVYVHLIQSYAAHDVGRLDFEP